MERNIEGREMTEIKEEDLMNIVERGFNAGEIEDQITEEESKWAKQQILQDHEDAKKLQNIKKYVDETLANIPEHCCYTHDDQREPLEGIQKNTRGREMIELKEDRIVKQLFDITQDAKGLGDLEAKLYQSELLKEILQDYEDAEDLKVLGGAEYVAEYFIKGEKDRQIVKRLEEQIKKKGDVGHSIYYPILQKILEGEK